MANINHHRKGIGAKLAYYGPPGSGKSTNLDFLNRHTANPAALMSVPHAEGRTVSFFLPVEPHVVQGVELRVRVITVQTRLETDKVWQQALRECDGVVFVADSRRSAVEANKRAMQRMADDLRAVGISPTGIPILLQLNFQDASDAMTAEDAAGALNASKWPVIASAASQGFGVFETAIAGFRLVCKHLQRQYLEIGGIGELGQLARVQLAQPKEPVELRRANTEHSPVQFLSFDAPEPSGEEPIVIDESVDVVDVAEAGEAGDEAPAAVIVAPALLGVTPPPMPSPVVAPVPPVAAPVEPPPHEVEVEIEVTHPAPAPAIHAQVALAALAHIRHCAADAQARLEAGTGNKVRIVDASASMSRLHEAAAGFSSVLSALAAEQDSTPPEGLDRVPAELAEVELLLGQYRERVEALEHELKTAESTATARQAALTAQLEAAKGVSAKLTEIDKTLEADLAKAKEEVEAARHDLALVRTAAEASGGENETLKGQVTAALEKAIEAETGLAAAEQRAAQAEQAASQHASEAAQAQADLAAAQQALAAAEEALRLAVSAGDALQAQVTALALEAQTHKAGAEKAVQDVVTLTTEAEQLRGQVTALQQQVDQLLAQAAAVPPAGAGSAEEVALLQAKVATLEEAAEAMRNYQALALRLQHEMREKDAKIAELTSGASIPAPMEAAAPVAAPAPVATPAPAKPSRPSSPPAAPAARIAGASTPPPAAAAPAAPDPLAAEASHAQRLAKALITEFASRFLPAITDAVAKGVFDQAFETHVKGMRRAYDARVSQQVRDTHDYLGEELAGLLAEIGKGAK
ncbi:MAG: hypothetical protein QM765_26930 [Myxococcales bacterium]